MSKLTSDLHEVTTTFLFLYTKPFFIFTYAAFTTLSNNIATVDQKNNYRKTLCKPWKQNENQKLKKLPCTVSITNGGKTNVYNVQYTYTFIQNAKSLLKWQLVKSSSYFKLKIYFFFLCKNWEIGQGYHTSLINSCSYCWNSEKFNTFLVQNLSKIYRLNLEKTDFFRMFPIIFNKLKWNTSAVASIISNIWQPTFRF